MASLQFVMVDAEDAAAKRRSATPSTRSLVRAQAMRVAQQWRRQNAERDTASKRSSRSNTGFETQAKPDLARLVASRVASGRSISAAALLPRAAGSAPQPWPVIADDLDTFDTETDPITCFKQDSTQIDYNEPLLALLTIRSPAIYRAGLKTPFIQNLFPHDRHYQLAAARVADMWLEPDTNPVRAGTDLHMLMTSLFEHYDARLALAARRRHVDTICTLRRQLERPQNLDVDSTAGSALALLLSEIYVMTSSGLGAWKKHIHGIGAILRSISSMKRPSRLGVFLFKAFRTCGLMFSFLLRQSLDLDSEGLITHVPSGSIEQLLCLATRLPPLLERTDKLKFRHSPTDIDDIRQQLCALERELADWALVFLGPTHLETIHGSIIHTLTATASRLPSPPPEPIPSTSFLETLHLTLNWTCLLLLRECLLDLERWQRSSPQSNDRCLTAEIDVCADYLCQSIPYLDETADGVLARCFAVSGPLHFASRWFRRSEDGVRLAWCEDYEARMRREVPYLQWEALLPWSLCGILWLAH